MLSSPYYRIRLLVILFAAVVPAVLIIMYGWLPSLSSYWNTAAQPLFIISNAATSYYLFFESQWKRSALALMLLTAFSVEYWPAIHNILAVCFFLLTLIPLYQSKRFRWVICTYIASGLGLFHSLLLAEIIGILNLCLYNILVLHMMYQLTKHKN